MKKYIIGIVAVFILSGCTYRDISNQLDQVDTQIANRQYLEASKIIDTLVRAYPTNTAILARQAELFFFNGEYQSFLDIRPNLSNATKRKLQRSELIAHIRLGQTTQAKTQIESLLKKSPTSDLYQLKGQIAYIEGDFDNALGYYDQALLLDPTNQEATINKAITYADKGEFEEGLTLLDVELEKNPDNYLLRYNKGTILSDLGYQQRNSVGTGSFSYYSDALRHFEQAYKLNPTHLDTATWLGITYLDLGQYAKAHQALQTVISNSPDAYDARYYEAKVYAAEGELQKAKDTYTQLLERNPAYELASQELILLENKEAPSN